jgi:SAM-dependent methyltransferase
MGSAEIQGAVWSAGARTWADLQEVQQSPFYEAAFDAIGVDDSVKLLDAGCGAGLAMERARVRGADVSGFDASPGLLAIAKERMPLVDLRQGDLEDLPYDDDAFDAVTAFNAVQFTEKPANALDEIKRVCKPGGRVAIVTWAPPEENEMQLVFSALQTVLPEPPPGVEPPSPFAIAKRGDMETRMGAAGLTVEEAIDVPVEFSYSDDQAALRGMVATGPGLLAAKNAGEDKAREVLGEALKQFVQDDGSVVLNNLFRVVPATA